MLAIAISVSVLSCNEQEIPMIDIVNFENIAWKLKNPCDIMYYDNKNQVILSGEIKYRGGLSNGYSKHSFALEFKKNTH